MEERLLVKSSENITKLLALMTAHERNVQTYLQRNNVGIEFIFNPNMLDISNINQILNRSLNIDLSSNTIDLSNVTYTTFIELDNHNELTCPITQEMFNSEDDVALLACGHYFKKDGFMVWARRSRTCPTCRTAFR